MHTVRRSSRTDRRRITVSSRHAQDTAAIQPDVATCLGHSSTHTARDAAQHVRRAAVGDARIHAIGGVFLPRLRRRQEIPDHTGYITLAPNLRAHAGVITRRGRGMRHPRADRGRQAKSSSRPVRRIRTSRVQRYPIAPPYRRRGDHDQRTVPWGRSHHHARDPIHHHPIQFVGILQVVILGASTPNIGSSGGCGDGDRERRLRQCRGRRGGRIDHAVGRAQDEDHACEERVRHHRTTEKWCVQGLATDLAH